MASSFNVNCTNKTKAPSAHGSFTYRQYEVQDGVRDISNEKQTNCEGTR